MTPRLDAAQYMARPLYAGIALFIAAILALSFLSLDLMRSGVLSHTTTRLLLASRASDAFKLQTALIHTAKLTHAERADEILDLFPGAFVTQKNGVFSIRPHVSDTMTFHISIVSEKYVEVVGYTQAGYLGSNMTDDFATLDYILNRPVGPTPARQLLATKLMKFNNSRTVLTVQPAGENFYAVPEEEE